VTGTGRPSGGSRRPHPGDEHRLRARHTRANAVIKTAVTRLRVYRPAHRRAPKLPGHLLGRRPGPGTPGRWTRGTRPVRTHAPAQGSARPRGQEPTLKAVGPKTAVQIV